MSQTTLKIVPSRRPDPESGGPVDRTKVLLVYDHPRARRSLAGLLRSSSELEVQEASDNPELLATIRHWDPVVVSIATPLRDGASLASVKRIHAAQPDVLIVVLTMQRSRAFVQRAIELGARGVVAMDHADTELLPAVAAVAGGDAYVSALALSPPAGGAALSPPAGGANRPSPEPLVS